MNTGDTNNPEAVAAAFAPDSDAAWAWAFPDEHDRDQWRSQGLGDAVATNAWADVGTFTALGACAWADQGVSPTLAKKWADLGVPPQQQALVIATVALAHDRIEVVRAIAYRIDRGEPNLTAGIPSEPFHPGTVGWASNPPARLVRSPDAPPVIIPTDPNVRDAWRTETSLWMNDQSPASAEAETQKPGSEP